MEAIRRIRSLLALLFLACPALGVGIVYQNQAGGYISKRNNKVGWDAYYDPNDGAQQWFYQKASGYGTGARRITICRSYFTFFGSGLECLHASCESGAKLYLESNTHDADDRFRDELMWTLGPTGELYKNNCQHLGLVVQKAPDGGLVMAERTNDSRDKWWEFSAGMVEQEKLYLYNQASNKAIDVEHNGRLRGYNGNAVTVTGDRATLTTWNMNRLGGLIRSSTGDGSYCMDLTDGKCEVGTPIQLWKCDLRNPNQLWTVFDNGVISSDKCNTALSRSPRFVLGEVNGKLVLVNNDDTNNMKWTTSKELPPPVGSTVRTSINWYATNNEIVHGFTWNEASNFCVNDTGGRLCNYSEICQNGKGGEAYGTQQVWEGQGLSREVEVSKDLWIPIANEVVDVGNGETMMSCPGNSWLQIGTWAGGSSSARCEKHDEIPEIGHCPSWGALEPINPKPSFQAYVACCVDYTL